MTYAVCNQPGKKIDWRSNKHGRSPSLNQLAIGEPHHVYPDHQCKVLYSNKYLCLNVVYQEDLKEKGWEHREKVAKTTCEWYLEVMD
jgi:hypothetical protein